MKLEKKTPEVPDIMNLPKPRPGKGAGRKAGLLALVAVLAVGGAAFWLTRDPSTRDQWREQAAGVIDNATSGTPLAGVGDLLRDAPPPPPSAVTNPSTAPGTLAGQNVQGTVPAPVDTSLPPGQSGLAGSGGAPGMAGQEAVQPVAPKVTADSKVRPDFVEDLAAYLVSRYKPGPRGGSLAVSVQSVNQRYGVKLAGQVEGGRAGLLRYAFHPTMLQSLYALYVDRFMAALDREAAAKSLSPEQNREMHMALAGRFVMLAGALEGVASVPDLGKRIKGLEQISQNVVDINSQMTAAVFDLDQLRENKASQPEIATTQLRVDGLSARYRRALEERAAAQRALVAAIRKGGGQALDDDSLLFVAYWVDRRLREGPQAPASVQSAAAVLRDLARRCAQAGAAAPANRDNPAAQPALSAPAAPARNTAPQTTAPQNTLPRNTQPQAGTRLPAAPAPAPAQPLTVPAPLVLFVGGTRSGKSGLAQRWAEAQSPRRLFLATCRVEDAEMAARVARHQAARGAGWHCVEEPLDPLAVLGGCPAGSAFGGAGVVLLDCVSLWIANLLAAGLTPEAVQARVAALAAGLAENGCRARPVALVSAETGLGIVPPTPLGRLYRDVLGLANQTLARACTHVIFVSCGLPLALKGPLPEGIC